MDVGRRRDVQVIGVMLNPRLPVSGSAQRRTANDRSKILAGEDISGNEGGTEDSARGLFRPTAAASDAGATETPDCSIGPWSVLGSKLALAFLVCGGEGGRRKNEEGGKDRQT